MAKFLTGNELNSELGKIFEEATIQLILISPYIRLHANYESILKTKRDNPELGIIIVFGKNEENPSRSMRPEDLDFFKGFPNIQIRYEKRLHAKYYANETSAILTSMNLHRHSQDNNIEAGVMTKVRKLGVLGDEIDQQEWEYFDRVIEQSELIYETKPEFDKGFIGSGLNKKYLKSKLTIDKLTEFFDVGSKQKISDRKTSITNSKEIKQPKQANDLNVGYCIRTGKEIPFNVKRPMCDESHQNWLKFGNEDYPEKFCHFSGEPSNGQTTYKKPILSKNWKKAKQVHGQF